MFDWEHFLKTYGIEYITSGPNVARGNVNISCPLCGSDPSHHMGISLEGHGWGCWRDPDHRGKSAATLVSLLLRVSKAEASRIVGERLNLTDDVVGYVQAKLGTLAAEDTSKNRPLKMPKEFLSFDTEKRSANLFKQYLFQRGYTRKQVSRMTKKYGIRYCTDGPFRGRIIFPIFFRGQLVNWTGRTIYKNETLRYKTLTTNRDRATFLGQDPAVGETNEYLLWYDELLEGNHETCVIVEGPFDALRIRVLGAPYGITATCFFTSAPSIAQVDLLREALLKFERSILLLDSGTVNKAMRIGLAFGGKTLQHELEVVSLPDDIKDPGDLTKKEFLNLLID